VMARRRDGLVSKIKKLLPPKRDKSF